MERKYNESTPQRPEGDRIVDDSIVEIDLPAYLKSWKEESTWVESDRNAITVFKTDGFTMVLVGLHKGAEMTRHVADGIMSIQLLEGNLIVTGEKRMLVMGAGQMAALHNNVPHSVKAEMDSFFLLTFTNTSEAKYGDPDSFGPAGSLLGSLWVNEKTRADMYD